MLSDSVIEKLVNYFWDDISEMSYDCWRGTSSGDKESVVLGSSKQARDKQAFNETDLYWGKSGPRLTPP